MKSLLLSLLLVTNLSAYADSDFDGVANDPEDTSQVTTLDRNQSFDAVISSGSSLLMGLKANQITPESFKEYLDISTQNLYSQGYISLSQLNAKLAQVDDCVEAEKDVRNPPPMGDTGFRPSNPRTVDSDFRRYLRDLRDTKCTAAIEYNSLKSAKPACIAANRPLAGGECCNGLIRGVSLSIESTTPGKKTNEVCNSHQECSSKNCTKDEGATSGLCAPLLTCFTNNAVGAECSPENPNCQSGVCLRQELGTGGVQCKVFAAACTNDLDCCSGKCASGKCAEKFVCEECIPEGAKPGNNQKCCRGTIIDLDGNCSREMPPFILPSSTSIKRNFWRNLAAVFSLISTVHATEIQGSATSVTPSASSSNEATATITSNSNTSQGNWVNDDALTEAQLDSIEGRIKDVLKIKDKAKRKQELLAVYAQRKEMTVANAAAIKAGQKIGKTLTQQEYVTRYNIPAITPKDRSNVERCEFNTGKDNWIDSSNLLRNAELFLRAFEVSYSGKGTEDMWHLLDKNGKPHKDNLYTRTKALMSEIRDNRNMQQDQLKYLDVLMACQCIYAFGPEKFDGEKQAFFYSQCTGQPDNKICRDGEMRNNLALPTSQEPEFRTGQEFPNYVEMYLAKLETMANQSQQSFTSCQSDTDCPSKRCNKIPGESAGLCEAVDTAHSIDAGAAGISHEEVLVRWLRLRSCNQVDVFMDTEKIETELQEIAEDLNRAKKPIPALTKYWESRLKQMAGGGVDKGIIDIFKQDSSKDTWYRGYVHTESKVHSWTKKSLKFLLFIILAILTVLTAGVALAAWAAGAAIAGAVLGVGLIVSGGGGGASGYSVLESFSRDFPNVIIEDRLVSKKSCGFLKLFYCKTFYRILHWPATSNRPGIESVFPWKKKEERTCHQTYQAAVGYQGVQPNPCSGPFKSTMCARSFFRPMPDQVIASSAEFAPWKELMRDRTLMDPVLPDFFSKNISLDNKWVPDLHQGFQKGCDWIKGIGKAKAKPEDKTKFFPNFDKYINQSGNFKPEYQFNQEKIDTYKQAVKKYTQCDRLATCGQSNYDGKHPDPRGFGDIFNVQEGLLMEKNVDMVKDAEERAELFANYVYQIHFKWRHMSAQAGIGYPLAYLESYYLALLHNVRLLTTLSVRRGLELDDAFNKYADDLRIRRNNYQFDPNKYGVDMGNDDRNRGDDTTSSVFRNFRALGFPLSAEFTGLPSGGGLPATGSSSATGASLSSFESNVLAAARRTATRVAKDNARWKNFKERTKGDAAAANRLKNAGKFFGGMNSPLSAVPRLAKPGDNSSYSGIGGQMGSLTGDGSGLAGDKEKSSATQKYGAVNSSGADSMGSSGSGLGSQNFNSSGLADDGLGNYGSGDSSSGTSGSSGSSSLSDAARMTGMKEGELKNMLDSAQRDRKNLSSGDDDSLFQKVSKAYLRNLDRVLLRKKGDLPVKKDAVKEANDAEKEALKKIFAQ
jgi:hypothetical protein